MATTTTNYGFVLPAVNDPTDADLWGTELNGNFTNLDGLLNTATNSLTISLTSNTVIDATYRNKTILADATGGSFTITLLPAATAAACLSPPTTGPAGRR